MLQEKDEEEVRRRLEEMENPVRIVNFTQAFECDFCRETRELLEETTALSEKLSLEVYDFVRDGEARQRYGVDKIPATVLVGEKDYGIRFYGIPAGYELVTLLEDIVMVSKRDSGLSAESRKKLAALEEPLHLQVFVTPTCPYCPRAVRLAHQFALESEQVVADMVEATEFPQLSQRYGVMGVPHTVANDRQAARGALPESHFLDHVLLALQEAKAS